MRHPYGWLDSEPKRVCNFHRRAAEIAKGDIFLAFRRDAGKLKSLSPIGHDCILSSDRYLSMMVVQYSTAVWFPFAVLSTAKGKLIHSANFGSRVKPRWRYLRDASTGGEKYSLTYPHSKAGTTPHCGKV